MRIRWRGLELPTRVVLDEAASTDTYGRFMVEPFERGFGTTVGNSLRRILLSSLQGAAVTHVKIKGAEHEFTTLRGVVEDVTEIILNVKSLIVTSSSGEPKTMRVSVKGVAGQTTEVRASDIEADAALEIINTDQILATLTDAVEFEMEMTAAQGRSYRTAEENKETDEDQIIGVIPVDSVFSPVTRVRYRVEDTRVGQRTNYDRLVLEIWTKGTVDPELALVESAKILRKHLNPFVMHFELGDALGAEEAVGDAAGVTSSGAETEGKLAMPVSALDLSVRSSNCLTTANIATVGELLSWDQANLLKLRSFGKTSLREVKRKLADHGLALRDDGSDVDDLDDDAGFGDSDEEQPAARIFGGGMKAGGGIAPLDSGSMGLPRTTGIGSSDPMSPSEQDPPFPQEPADSTADSTADEQVWSTPGEQPS
jgi:DNA-directed RNA polymerase subunit alpha